MTVVISTAEPCRRKGMRLMTPKSARKSPKTLTNCANHRVRKCFWRKTDRGEGGAEVTRYDITRRATLRRDGFDQGRATPQGPRFRSAAGAPRRRARARPTRGQLAHPEAGAGFERLHRAHPQGSPPGLRQH